MQIEKDTAQIVSGVRHGYTLGSPIALVVQNNDWKHWTKIMGAEPLEKVRRMKLNEKSLGPSRSC